MIEPALTAEEWRASYREKMGMAWQAQDRFVTIIAFCPTDWRPYYPQVGLLADHINQGIVTHRPVALMALANATLLDDDPHKITRADVEAVLALSGDYGENSQRYGRHGEDMKAGLALAAKLAALLPPESESDVERLIRDEFRANHPPMFPEEGW